MQRGVLGCAGSGTYSERIAAKARHHQLTAVESGPGLALFVGAGLAVTRNGSHIIVGDIFRGGETTGADDAWGNFLSFSVADEAGLQIERAALTGMPLYWIAAGQEIIFFSHLELALGLGIPLAVDMEFVRYLLAYSNFRSARTGLVGVFELLSGTSLRQTSQGCSIQTFWSPWTFTSQAKVSIGASPKRLEEKVIDCVSMWSASRPAIMIELSGGLDSSIVAAALSATRSDFSAANVATVSPDGDERHYARAVASECGVSLIEAIHDDASIDLLTGSCFPNPRPATYGVLAGIDRALGDATNVGSSCSIFSGIGGDNVFALTRTLVPALDSYEALGPCILSYRALRDSARLCNMTLWHAARAMCRMCRSRPDGRWPRDDDYVESSALPDAPLPHPWDEGADNQLLGKTLHVHALQRIIDFLDRPGRWYDRDMVAPLLSQPIVELCLSIPSWDWIAGGRDRAVARRAFSTRLPATVVWRRNKGRLETMCAGAFLAQRSQLAALLLEGQLARARLLDRRKIEDYLARGNIEGNYDYFRLLELADIELWIASLDCGN